VIAAMEAYAFDWLNLLVRWLHLTAGIAWIGASFYFIWLDNHLRPPERANARIAGELWSIHGGGFYRNEKFLLGPERIPDELHWFKWEAYFTFLSGFALLAIVYWHGARTYLIDADVADLSPAVAIGLSAGSLVLAWLVYDGLCRSPLGERGPARPPLGVARVITPPGGVGQIFSGRAAYLHVGAMIGTIMVANVYFVIIPGQEEMVAAIRAGRAPDPAPGLRGKQRSVHNNYLTLPVLLLMLSQHYPMTYQHEHAWAVLGALVVIGVVVRHFFNLRHKGRIVVALPAAAIAGVVALALVIAPPGIASRPPATAGADAVPFDEVRAIINERCVACHAARPTQEGIAAPPAGIILETPQQIRRFAGRIYEQAVTKQAMPAGNLTEMTAAERATLGTWFQSGAPVN
jgi:uncharacterized membrane protein